MAEGDVPADGQAPAKPKRPQYLEDIYAALGLGDGGSGYEYTPEDLDAIAQYITMQQLEGQVAGIGLQGRQADLTGRQLDQQMAEQDFVQQQYFPWYSGPYFENIKQQAANDLLMSQDKVRQSANYLAGQRYQTDQARYAAQTARDQLWESRGVIPPSAARREQQRQQQLRAAQGGQGDQGRSNYGYRTG